MSKIYRADGFDVTVTRDEIARYLGYGTHEIPRRVAKMIKEIEDNAMTLLEPACAYRTMTNDEFFHSHYVCHLSAIVVCLVTIGSRLEEVVTKYKLSGDLSHALILDSYGSAAAEAAADVAESMIQELIAKSGLKASPRFSPGYGGWDSFGTFASAEQKAFEEWYKSQYPLPEARVSEPAEIEYKAPGGYDSHLDHWANFFIAIRTGLPILPTTIIGSFEAWLPRAKIIRGGTITVVIGPPVTTRNLTIEDAPRLRDEVKASIEATLAEFS